MQLAAPLLFHLPLHCLLTCMHTSVPGPGSSAPAASSAAHAWPSTLPPTSAPPPAGLESLDLSQNCFKKLPAGLLAATRLTALSLDGNRNLELTKGDVKRVLLRLPALQRLRLKDTRTEAHVLQHLVRQAPEPRVVLGAQ